MLLVLMYYSELIMLQISFASRSYRWFMLKELNLTYPFVGVWSTMARLDQIRLKSLEEHLEWSEIKN